MSDGAISKGGVFTEDNTVPPSTSKVLPLFSLRGKTAIVSGAGAGIGLAVAQGLAEAGADVAIWYNSNKKALDRAKEIEQDYGVKCKAYQVDVTSEDRVKASVNEIVKEFNGRLDIFVANSGVAWTQGPALDGELSHYHKVVSTDLDGTFFCARAAGEHWRRQKLEGVDVFGKKIENFTYGSFIATASMSGHIVNIPQLQAAYNAAKAGVIHLTKSLAVEWVKFARANSVSPGYMATELTDFIPPETKAIWKSKIPMGRQGEPFELKGAFLFLASDASSYCTGVDLAIDGGYLLP
ncbi:MAG: L-xylulose reductase [Chrysothrix sp. TS-e1954]|nr:MAG: L-xylulose reductase [Chrysothrix sp. TS-e1954]